VLSRFIGTFFTQLSDMSKYAKNNVEVCYIVLGGLELFSINSFRLIKTSVGDYVFHDIELVLLKQFSMNKFYKLITMKC